MKMKIFLSLISMFLIFGCTSVSSDTQKNTEKSKDFSSILKDTSWELTEISGKKIDLSDKDSEKSSVTLNFTSEGINGIAAVNRYFSSYVIKGDTISFEVIASTKMAGPEKLMNLEIKYLGILGKSEKIQMPDNDTLILKSGNEILKFKKI